MQRDRIKHDHISYLYTLTYFKAIYIYILFEVLLQEIICFKNNKSFSRMYLAKMIKFSKVVLIMEWHNCISEMILHQGVEILMLTFLKLF